MSVELSSSVEEFTAVGEEGVVEGGGEDSFRRKHGNKCAKPTKVEGGEDMPGEFCQVHSKRDVQILEESFEGVKVSLGTSDPMKEANEFMGNRVFMERGISLMAWRTMGVLRMAA